MSQIEKPPAADMGAPDPAAWGPRLAQVFASPVPPLTSLMERTILEAVVLPEPQLAIARAVPSELSARPREDTAIWLARVLRGEVIEPARLAQIELLGVRGALGSQDALFGALETRDGARFVQLAVTQQRIHVRLRMPSPCPEEEDARRTSAALVLGAELFRWSVPMEPGRWDIRRLGAYSFAVQPIAFRCNWHEACLIVTDGVGVKYSFLKYLDRTSPPKGGGPRLPPPWFPGAEQGGP